MKITPKFELITSEDKFYALEVEWNSLLQDSDANNIFLTWEWISTWWACFGRGCQLWVLVARSADVGRILGLAPLHLKKSSLIPGILPHHRELTLIGTNAVAPDHLDFIIRKGYEGAVAKGFVDYIYSHSKWDILRLDALSSSSPIAPLLIHQTTSWGNSLIFKPGSIIQLPERWDIFYSALGKNLRKNLKKYARQLEHDNPGQVKYSIANNQVEIKSTLQILFHLANQVSEVHDRTYALRTSEIKEFHYKVADVLHQQKWVRIYKITVGDEIIAVLYCFNYNDVVSDYQTSYSLSWQKYRPGQEILAYSIQQAINQGARVYDFLRGGHPYLDLWTTDSRKDIYLKIGWNLKGRILITLYSFARLLRDAILDIHSRMQDKSTILLKSLRQKES